MNTRSLLEQLPSVLAAELQSLRATSDPSSRFLYENFVPTAIQLMEDGEPIHGRTLSEKAIHKADRVSIVFERRTGAPMPPPPQKSNVADASRSPVEEILMAYREAAKSRQFVGLKWFRDAWIPSQAFGWSTDAEKVRALLAEAIDHAFDKQDVIGADQIIDQRFRCGCHDRALALGRISVSLDVDRLDDRG